MVLGVAESLILPSMLILLANWFTKEERSKANAILILGNPITVTWMSAATGYLIHAIGWQWTFIVEGIPSVLWAFVWIAVARDHPPQVRWLSKESSAHLTEKLALEQIHLPAYKNLGACLRLPGVNVLCIQYFTWSFGVYGLTLWIPEMIRSGLSVGIERTGILSAAPFLLGIILMIIVSAVPIVCSKASHSCGRSSCFQALAYSARSQLSTAISGFRTLHSLSPAARCLRRMGHSSPSCPKCCRGTWPAKSSPWSTALERLEASQEPGWWAGCRHSLGAPAPAFSRCLFA